MLKLKSSMIRVTTMLDSSGKLITSGACKVKSEQTIQNFFNNYTPRKFHARQVFLFPGEISDHVYFVVEGKVRKYYINNRGDEITVGLFGAGHIFSLSQAINHSAEWFHFEAEGNVVIQMAPMAEFDAFIDMHPDVSVSLLRQQIAHENDFSKRMVHLMNSTAKQRLIYELIRESQHSAVPKAANYHLSINESQLAARAGLTRETISRAMRELKAEKLVSIESNKIIVNDLLGLETKLGGFI